MSITLEKLAGRADPPDMEGRVAMLEAGQQETRATLARVEAMLSLNLAKTDKLAERVDGLSGRFDKMSERFERIIVDVAELKGQVSQLPTSVTLLGLSLAVLAMAGVLKVFVK